MSDNIIPFSKLHKDNKIKASSNPPAELYGYIDSIQLLANSIEKQGRSLLNQFQHVRRYGGSTDLLEKDLYLLQQQLTAFSNIYSIASTLLQKEIE